MNGYSSIHKWYYSYHENHGTDQLLKRPGSAEEAKCLFLQYGDYLQLAKVIGSGSIVKSIPRFHHGNRIPDAGSHFLYI